MNLNGSPNDKVYSAQYAQHRRSAVIRILHAIFLVVAALVYSSGGADAQAACPEGKTASGQCVNPGLADGMRQNALIFSQPKISFTAFPILPADDFTFRYPNQLIPNPLAPSPTGTPVSTPPVGVPVPSDIRLKRDIALLAHLNSGINLYRFRYKWSDTFYVGVMAQEVIKVAPAAVMQGPDGYLRVDYTRIGLKFQTWKEWIGSAKAAAAAVGR